MFNKFKYLTIKETNTPVSCKYKVKRIIIAQLNYGSALGSFMYKMHNMRPDIAYVVGMLSSFTSMPSMAN